MNEINLMKKLLYLLVMPLILAACNPKVELTSAGMYPNYQVGEIVNLIPVGFSDLWGRNRISFIHSRLSGKGI